MQSVATDTNEQEATKEFFAMDTVIDLKVYGDNAEEALESVEKEIEYLDSLLSTGDENSEIFALNQSGSAILSDVSAYLFERSCEIYDLSGGAFNPMIYPIVEAWGFPSENYHVLNQDEIDAILPLTDISKVTYDKDTHQIQFELDGMAIDFGGIAKGYTSDRIKAILEDYGITSALINLGGNVYVRGLKPNGNQWKIAIQDPYETDDYGSDDYQSYDYIGIFNASDCVVITSGGYERYFDENGVRYHHILDPSTGVPANSGLISVSIISDDGTLADGLSTSLFVLGLEKSIDLWREHSSEFDAILMTDENEIYITEGLKDNFVSEKYPIHVISLSDTQTD